MKKKWINLFTTQFVGVFNDNLLKNLICFIAVFWSPENQKSLVISLASALMVLPYILLSPIAATFAQKYRKSMVLSRAKLFEIPIMLLAIGGFYWSNMIVVMSSMCLMGIQSSLYSPAKYGLIKDFTSDNNLSRKLGVMETLAFCGVLIGCLVAGVIADTQISHIHQTLLIAFALLSAAIIGYFTSIAVNQSVSQPLSPSLSQPARQPLRKQSGKSIWNENEEGDVKQEVEVNPFLFFISTYQLLRQYKGVNWSIMGLGLFWFIGAILQMNILVHCPKVMNLSSAQTGLVTAALAVGIGLGCYVSGQISKKRLEMGLTFFAAIGMAISLLCLQFSHWSIVPFVFLLITASFCGGLFKIPLNTWIQQQSSLKVIANSLAYSNMVVFLFILLAAFTFSILTYFFHTYQVFAFTGVLAFLTSLFILFKIPIAVVRFFTLFLSKCLFRIKIKGAPHIPLSSGGIIVCNHVSMLDSLLILATVPRNIRFVMHEGVYGNRFLNPLFKRCNMIPVSSGKSKDALKSFTASCKKEVDAGHLICIFPEGQLSRTGQILPFKRGIEHLIKSTKAPVIPMHLENLIGTPLSFKTGTSKRYSFSPLRIRKKVYVLVGRTVTQAKTAFELRQVIKELEVENVALKTKLLKPEQAVVLSKKQIHKKGDSFQKSTIIEFKDLVMNTPNYLIKDLWGKNQTLIGAKPGAYGRPIPGATITTWSDDNEPTDPLEEGRILIKHAFSECIQWMETGYYGFIDESGFLEITR